jgi:hypothetical protein
VSSLSFCRFSPQNSHLGEKGEWFHSYFCPSLSLQSVKVSHKVVSFLKRFYNDSCWPLLPFLACFHSLCEGDDWRERAHGTWQSAVSVCLLLSVNTSRRVSFSFSWRRTFFTTL